MCCTSARKDTLEGVKCGDVVPVERWSDSTNFRAQGQAIAGSEGSGRVARKRGKVYVSTYVCECVQKFCISDRSSVRV